MHVTSVPHQTCIDPCGRPIYPTSSKSPLIHSVQSTVHSTCHYITGLPILKTNSPSISTCYLCIQKRSTHEYRFFPRCQTAGGRSTFWSGPVCLSIPIRTCHITPRRCLKFVLRVYLPPSFVCAYLQIYMSSLCLAIYAPISVCVYAWHCIFASTYLRFMPVRLLVCASIFLSFSTCICVSACVSVCVCASIGIYVSL